MAPAYDLLIIGGGMVGASLATALLPVAHSLGLSIAVIEAQAMPGAGEPYQPSYDARTTALSFGARSFYERTGVWQRLAEHLTPIEHIHVSDKGHFGAARLHAKEEGVPALGYVVENHWLGRVLLDHLRDKGQGAVDLICPAEVVSLTHQTEGYRVEVQSGGDRHECIAQLVVMADGGRSELRNTLGIPYSQESYQQYALVSNVSIDRPHAGVAYERFTATGPMALLPSESQGYEHRCGLIWTLPEASIDRVLNLSDKAFIRELQETFGYRAGRFMRVGERYHYPLKLTVAQEQVRTGLVMLGNAAHSLHPIAGQGYNLALRGVTDLAETIVASCRQQRALGDLEALQAFEQKRRQDQFRTIAFSDKTMKLFSNTNSISALGRDLGLQLLDVSPPLKSLLARSAMGLDYPALRV